MGAATQTRVSPWREKVTVAGGVGAGAPGFGGAPVVGVGVGIGALGFGGAPMVDGTAAGALVCAGGG